MIPFILTTQRSFISTDCNEYAYNVDIKLKPYVCLIHKSFHLEKGKPASKANTQPSTK